MSATSGTMDLFDQFVIPNYRRYPVTLVRGQATEVRHLTGVTTLVDEADDKEERAGGDAVVDHLDHPACKALQVHGEDPEHDEAKVGHR